MFTLPDLPYDYSALEPFIDTETMHLHHDKHHAAYVKNLNEALVGHDGLLDLRVEKILSDLSKVPEEIRTKVKNNGGGHANHSMFWEIMCPPSDSSKPNGALETAINSAFGDFPTFQEKFASIALARFGSGWAWLIADDHGLSIVDTQNQDSPVSVGKIPILLIDVWEHAYYLKYKNMRADYIKAWWNVVNWKEVERRFNEA